MTEGQHSSSNSSELSHDPVVERLDRLILAITTMNNQAHEIRTATRRRDWLLGTQSVLLIVLMVLTGVDLARTTSLNNIAATNRQRNQTTANNTNIIKDCTTAGGACYERNRAQTSRAIAGAVAAVSAMQRDLACSVLTVLPQTTAVVAAEKHDQCKTP